MSPEVRGDLDQLLKYSMKVTQAMIEIACMREWFFTAQAMIEFRRGLVQALDVKGSPLLQIPHFTEEVLSHCKKGKNAITSLADFMSKSSEDRKGVAKMNPSELADIDEFCLHASDVELKATAEVEDEKEIVLGDIATVSFSLLRKNLKEGEALGPVHAPFFPEPKFEEWWLFLVEGSQNMHIIAYERIRDTERLVEEKMRFQVTRPGKHNLTLYALSDAYVGIDQKVELSFNVLRDDEVKREIVVHPDDEDLDLQPTLFQQFMGELNHEEDSEDEEETDKKDKDKKKPPVKKDLGTAAKKAKASSDDSGDDKKKGAKKDDSDSDSSSDSD